MSYKIVNHVQALIELGKGDIGRLVYILEKLKQNKSLYSSDQRYLENITKAFPMPQIDDKSIVRETFQTQEVNSELKTELKFAYQEIEKLESELLQLRKEKSSILTQTPSQILVERPKPILEQIHETVSSSIVRYVDATFTPEQVIDYAKQSSQKRTKGGMFSKSEFVETPIAWERFLYPYYDVAIEITMKEIEKVNGSYESATKVIKCRICVDGITSAIVGGTKEGISYSFDFLKDLSADEIALLYYVHNMGDFTVKDLLALGTSIEKSIKLVEKLVSKGLLKRENGTKFRITKDTRMPNPAKLNCIMEDHTATATPTSDRVIKPLISSAALPLQLSKYWARCHIPSSSLVYYPYYGITYDRKDYYRIEIIDGVSGNRQERLEQLVTVRPKNKITEPEN